MEPSEICRFEKFIIPEPNSGCWLWIGCTDTLGYGSFRYHGAMRSSHRISYSIYKGEIPDKMHVLHKCDTRLCVNPAHLWLGTHEDNMKDRDLKKRVFNMTKTHCPKGHEYSGENLAIYIRKSTGLPKRICRICERQGLRSSRARAKLLRG